MKVQWDHGTQAPDYIAWILSNVYMIHEPVGPCGCHGPFSPELKIDKVNEACSWSGLGCVWRVSDIGILFAWAFHMAKKDEVG